MDTPVEDHNLTGHFGWRCVFFDGSYCWNLHSCMLCDCGHSANTRAIHRISHTHTTARATDLSNHSLHAGAELL